VYPTPHHAKEPPSAAALAELERLTAPDPAAHASLIKVYSQYDGLDFCNLYCPDCPDGHPALSLLPVEEWKAATDPWLPGGEMASFMEGGGYYDSGSWRVIGRLPSEAMCVVLFFDGAFEGMSLTGKVFTIGLDGYLGFEDELSKMEDGKESHFGDPIESYLPDARAHPALAHWPSK